MDSAEVNDILRPLILDDNTLKEVSKKLLQEMNRGLNKTTHHESSVKMLPTYVRKMPTGKEEGEFLALDLGGTNFRVLMITLAANRPTKMISKIFAIPQQIMIGPGKDLFDHIAKCLAEFIKENGLEDSQLPLGFTFSFPCRQEGLTSARLVQWTKGFKCEGVVNEDVVKLLEEAVARKKVKNIDVYAILNDTTGTLMSCAFLEPTCKIGLIVGTGTNACYVERLENIDLYDGELNDPRHMVINMEWGAFGDNGHLDFILTKYDRLIDDNTFNKGQQLFEKMISGMYMGEIVRHVLVELTVKGLLFSGNGSEALFERQRFYTKYVSEIESEGKDEFEKMKAILQELNLSHASPQDHLLLRHVCEVVSKRAAYLVSAGIATIINKIDHPFVTVAVDGSVFRLHPSFSNLMLKKTTQLVKPGLKFQFMLSEDGSGRGAALVAAVAALCCSSGHQL